LILQLDPTIPLETNLGKGFAHFLMDAGQEHTSLFGVFIDKTGEFWWVDQRFVRVQHNWTMGRQESSQIES